MPLINLKTNLKSLKFGKDRPGGGSSNQPYIKSKIPDQNSDQSSILNTGGPDSLLRGGILAPIRAAEDTSRLTQMFADTKSPIGLLFTAKQNILSRLSVHTEASTGAGYGAGKVNQGVYLPTSTIAQSAAGVTGTHLNTFGLDPLTPMTGGGGGLFGIGLKRYEDVVRRKNENDNNRLVEYLDTYINKKNNNPLLSEITGGPGSVLGIGKSLISFTKQRTGINNLTKSPKTPNPTDNFILPLGKLKKSDGTLTNYWGAINKKDAEKDLRDRIELKKGNLTYEPLRWDIYKSGPEYKGILEKDKIAITGIKRGYLNTPNPTDDFISPTGSVNYEKKLGENNNLNTEISKDGSSWLNSKSNKVYKSGSLKSDPEVTGTTTWTQQQISKVESDRVKGQIQDFRDKIKESPTKKVLGKLANGYEPNIQIDKRVNYGSPGRSNIDVTKYGVNIADKKALDKITASPIYTDSIANHSGEKNDLCKFSIGVINNDKTGTSNFMHFRAFIDGFSDSYTADWNETQYVGRADKFYNYKGFGRSISLSFTVAAQSKAELIPMYKKLNYLASSLAPSYSQGGFMQGNLVRLTVGGYLYNQVGILKGITYTIPQESPWEIGLDDGYGNDNTVKELPHIIKVTGFDFTPIQDFVPQVGNPQNQVDTRFISLANGSGEGDNNYSNS